MENNKNKYTEDLTLIEIIGLSIATFYFIIMMGITVGAKKIYKLIRRIL